MSLLLRHPACVPSLFSRGVEAEETGPCGLRASPRAVPPRSAVANAVASPAWDIAADVARGPARLVAHRHRHDGGLRGAAAEGGRGTAEPVAAALKAQRSRPAHRRALARGDRLGHLRHHGTAKTAARHHA